MSVHKEISLHAQKQNQLYQQFIALDDKREHFIEEAVELCKAGREFTTDRINQVTEQINRLANHRLIPSRKWVTEEMVREYVKKLQEN
ncbi:DUF2533 family protein [Bacillus xiapuensis]|uniref:DUF2533 family protein n=1 Tax=Bacillus xiapuensis TaxID=2014075 RepID=UPI000C231568|nr:DUF2533 family protein [Bacillus xiapuensis]